jgi:hypothetical protein
MLVLCFTLPVMLWSRLLYSSSRNEKTAQYNWVLKGELISIRGSGSPHQDNLHCKPRKSIFWAFSQINIALHCRLWRGGLFKLYTVFVNCTTIGLLLKYWYLEYFMKHRHLKVPFSVTDDPDMPEPPGWWHGWCSVLSCNVIPKVWS